MVGRSWLRRIEPLVCAVSAESALIHLGHTYASAAQERRTRLPGNGIVANPKVVTNRAVTI